MKIKRVLSWVVLSVVMASPALAFEEDLYGRISVGVSVNGEMEQSLATNPDLEFLIPPPTSQSFEPNVGFNGGAAVGLRFSSYGLRGEVEYRYTSSDVDEVRNEGVEVPPVEALDDTLSAHSVFGNLIYDFEPISSFVPYIGAGVGIANVSSIEGNDDTAIAFQVKGGVEMPLTSGSAISLEYSYMRTGELELGPQEFSPDIVTIISDTDPYSVSSLTLSYIFGF